MDFSERKFESPHKNGNGNGRGSGKETGKNPAELLRSKAGELDFEAKKLETEIRILTQALAEGAREISDADIRKINEDLQATVKRLSEVLDALKNLEEEMWN